MPYIRCLSAVLTCLCLLGNLRSQPAEKTRSVLVVAGDNYEEFHTFRHFVDPEVKARLETKGWAVGECSWEVLTPEILDQFQTVIFLQTPDTFIKADKERQLEKMTRLLEGYLAKGGGALIFPDLFRGTVHKTVNVWLNPYGIKALPQTVLESPRNQNPFDAYPAMGVAFTANITNDPITEGVKKFVYPEGNELTTTFVAEPEWKVLVRGEKSARTAPNEGVVEQDALVAEAPPIVAVREAGGGRLAYWSGHSSFFVLKPFHPYWDEGRVLAEGDGQRLLDNLLAWLAANPSGRTGGFQTNSQDKIFHFDRAREQTLTQEQKFPGRPRRGVVGLQSRWSGGTLSVAELCAEARKLGLDYVVFTEDAAVMSDPETWRDYVQACAEATDAELLVFPGVLVTSPETQDRAVVFNLRKPWPETPWNEGDFDSFVRIGVNNAWRAFFALLEPSCAPVPVANQGAVNALAVETVSGTNREDSSGLFQKTQREMWGFSPIRYKAVRTAEELAMAAASDTTFLYSEKWGREFSVSQDDVAFSAVGDGPILTQFEARSDSTWSPPFSSQYRGRLRVEQLSAGQIVELWFGQNRLRAVPASDGEVAFDFSFQAGGSGHLFVRALDKDGRAVLQASALKFAKVRFNSFVGSDRMNGYWYPVREARADTPRSVFIEGKYGIIGISVYPQLAWGDHWFFRSENQMSSEPLGFEVGAPPGTIERMWAGFYLKLPSGWEELAPWRAMSFFSSDAAVWSDSHVALRRKEGVGAQKRDWVEPSALLDRAMDVTGYRWDDHAVLWVEARAALGEGADPATLPDQRVLALRLGDAWKRFSTRSILRASGQIEQKELRAEEAFELGAGDGISLGDMPMGMVSAWPLQNLEGSFTEEASRPYLQLRLPDSEWPPSSARPAKASYLVVISRHDAGTAPCHLETVREAVFPGNFWQGASRKNPADPLENFRQLVMLKDGGAWAGWSRPGKPWRGEIRGFSGSASLGVLSRAGDGWKWQPVETADGKGLVFLSETPPDDAFIGQPVGSDAIGLQIEMGTPNPAGRTWKVTLHNPTGTALAANLEVHAGLARFLKLDDASLRLAPGETQTRTLKWKLAEKP